MLWSLCALLNRWHEAAVDKQFGAGRRRRSVTDSKGDRGRDFTRQHLATERNGAVDLGARFIRALRRILKLLEQPLRTFGRRDARRYGVDAHVVRRELLGGVRQ